MKKSFERNFFISVSRDSKRLFFGTSEYYSNFFSFFHFSNTFRLEMRRIGHLEFHKNNQNPTGKKVQERGERERNKLTDKQTDRQQTDKQKGMKIDYYFLAAAPNSA